MIVANRLKIKRGSSQNSPYLVVASKKAARHKQVTGSANISENAVANTVSDLVGCQGNAIATTPQINDKVASIGR
ncbi:hypothetical protein K239x_29860 [Planctomycetes bacterium K23_9]|uniref:Uncharacterized protein n=1 Tax=Stieleria marina TaxID=1930275 RepID=A0A517NV49_9BACT|nr:hypothetical protein K239x_29860 [Planctomycetes bacterium K23_9]